MYRDETLDRKRPEELTGVNNCSILEIGKFRDLEVLLAGFVAENGGNDRNLRRAFTTMNRMEVWDRFGIRIDDIVRSNLNTVDQKC